jgi:hypothetical protein
MVHPLTASPHVPTDLYEQLQQFYARHMHAGDSGDIGAWAACFTEDAVFVSNGLPHPLRGRAAIEATARLGAADRAERGATHRHLVTMLDVHRDHSVAPGDADDSVVARSYVLVVESVSGGKASLHLSAVCEDTLVRGDGTWLVRERRVTRDDLPAAPAA